MKETMERLDKYLLEYKKIGFRKTAELRKISKKIHTSLKSYSFVEKIEFCELLLAQRVFETDVIAYEIAYREQNNYNIDTFKIFERWLKTYVTSWKDCDDFCVHAFGSLVYKYPELYEKVLLWCSSDNFCVRRAASVVPIYSIRRGALNQHFVFTIASMLMSDDHYLVLKGCGWLLREYGVQVSEEVFTFLEMNIEKIPRVVFRYALRSLEENQKNYLMSLEYK